MNFITGKDQHGENNPRWKGGKKITEKGYVRISAGPNRGKYEHILMIEDLQFGRPVPKGFEVHHQDHNRSHNCPSNLLVLQKCLHEGWAKRIKKR